MITRSLTSQQRLFLASRVCDLLGCSDVPTALAKVNSLMEAAQAFCSMQTYKLLFSQREMPTTTDEEHEKTIQHVFLAFYEPLDFEQRTWRNKVTGKIVRREKK